MERSVKVAAADGLHARPAGAFVKEAERLGGDVRIATPGGAPVPAASILSVMGLGVGSGQEVILSGDDETVLEALAALLEDPAL
jgi:phosphocarrier protein